MSFLLFPLLLSTGRDEFLHLALSLSRLVVATGGLVHRARFARSRSMTISDFRAKERYALPDLRKYVVLVTVISKVISWFGFSWLNHLFRRIFAILHIDYK